MTTRLFSLLAAALAPLLGGCRGLPDADAYGNFEAVEVVVSAQSAGRLVAFSVEEGDRVAAGATVGLVDTVQMAAGRDALVAQRQALVGQQRALRVQARATGAQAAEAEAGVAVLEAQLATAREEYARTQRLFEGGAATARELNERAGALAALTEQLGQARARRATAGAQSDVPTAQADAFGGQIAALDAQIAQIRDRIADATIANPTAGTVLSVVARQGETVQPGSPLYTVADVSRLRLRAFATGDQLPRLRLGMAVEVLVDDGAGGLEKRRGKVVSIASEAEFTPTPIQTRSARGDLVYAFLVQVPNPDGRLKIGMPGEVRFLDAAP